MVEGRRACKENKKVATSIDWSTQLRTVRPTVRSLQCNDAKMLCGIGRESDQWMAAAASNSLGSFFGCIHPNQHWGLSQTEPIFSSRSVVFPFFSLARTWLYITVLVFLSYRSELQASIAFKPHALDRQNFVSVHSKYLIILTEISLRAHIQDHFSSENLF